MTDEMISPARSDAYWQAVVARDATRDGEFVFAVKTTGIYCRPSCPARRPNRDNVVFFLLNKEAEAAGYRACKRCKPKDISLEQANRLAVEAACALIEDAEQAPDLGQLADASGLSKFHFHRIFKAHTGMTPKQYAKARQDMRIRNQLNTCSRISDAIHVAGFETSARFYERAERILGMLPSDYKDGGKNQAIWYAFANTALGRALIAGTHKGICALQLGEDDAALLARLTTMFPKARLQEAADDMADEVRRIVHFVDTPDALFDLPLDVQGTVFQHKVWQALRTLSSGETTTYSELAEQVERADAVRAVANACGANPVALAIPCHRVVRSDGTLGGYRWGLARKETLLARERDERDARG